MSASEDGSEDWETESNDGELLRVGLSGGEDGSEDWETG